ncbi:MAG: hypothetical protein ACK5HY_17025, partial [Parahaliea sp.]
MLDHDHRVPLVHQRVEHFEEFADVFEMQARGSPLPATARFFDRCQKRFFGRGTIGASIAR